jgi:type I restriction enzyme, S subunit
MVGDSFERTTFEKLILDGALEIGDGYRAKNEELGGDGLMFLRAGHVTDTHIDFDGVERFRAELEPRVRSKLAVPGDAVVTTKGNSTGRTTFVTASMPQFVYSPHLSYWRSKDRTRIEGGFLRYWSRGQEFVDQLSGMKTSTDMAPYLSLNDQKRLHISLPPITEQRAIAHILGTLDAKIDLNRRMNETLEGIARELFNSWFVGFDPVRAKAEGRDPGLPQPLADLFPDSFEDSELGEIPKGWRLSRLGDEVDTLLGGTPSRVEPAYWGGDIPWINSGKANEFRIIEPSEFITQVGLDSSATKLLPAHTTVIAITGATLGQVSITEIATCANQSIVGVLGSAEMPSEYIYFWIKENVDQLIANQTGGAQQHINKNNVNELPIVCPPRHVSRAFAATAVPTFERIKKGCFESRTVAALRDALLPKLILGELRVEDASRFIEGAD